MKIIITHDESLITSQVLKSISEYFDGHCLPQTLEPKKYYFNPETGDFKNGHSKIGESNVSLLFLEG